MLNKMDLQSIKKEKNVFVCNELGAVVGSGADAIAAIAMAKV